MGDFHGFSELARLSAENASLVDRAKAQFSKESKQLIEHLAEFAETPRAPRTGYGRGFRSSAATPTFGWARIARIASTSG